jgi:hypothetical protein
MLQEGNNTRVIQIAVADVIADLDAQVTRPHRSREFFAS